MYEQTQQTRSRAETGGGEMAMGVAFGYGSTPATGASCCAGAESLAERGLPFAGIAGAALGAFGGALAANSAGTAFPELFGTVGTIVGSVFAVGAWLLCTGRSAQAEPHEHLPVAPKGGW